MKLWSRNRKVYNLVAVLLLTSILLSPISYAPLSAAPAAVQSYIVRAASLESAAEAVEAVGGQITTELGIINAVGAELSAQQAARLAASPLVSRVWANSSVQSADSADPGIVYSPQDGWETEDADFDLDKVVACDGSKEKMDNIPVDIINPLAYQAYIFTPVVDPDNLPSLVDLRIVFKEKRLNQAQLQVYQASTGVWHTFEIDTLSTDNKFIDATLDLTEALITPQDFARVEVRFLVSRKGGRGRKKAKVDLVSLRLAELVGEANTVDVADSSTAADVGTVLSDINQDSEVDLRGAG